MIPYLSPPEPIRLFGLRLPLFGLLLFASVLVTYAAVLARGRATAIAAPREVARFAQVLLVAAVAGAHTGGILAEHGPGALARPALFLSTGGAVSSAAGVVATAVAGASYVAAKRLDPRRWADLVAWSFPFGLLVARSGCALAHDHPGRLSSSWLAVPFPGGARLDCGLLEAMAAPVLIALAVALGRRRLAPGRLAGAVGGAYALFRFSLDFLRAADLPGADARHAGLTFAQWVCAPLLVASAYLLLARRPAAPPVPPVDPAHPRSGAPVSSPTVPR